MTAAILEPASPEVKRYQGQKIAVTVTSTVLSLAWLAVLGVFYGSELGAVSARWLGDNYWLRVIAAAVVVGATLEVISFPFDFYSGYILEHRFQLSNQTLAGWLWRRCKGYLVGAVFGLLLVMGLYGVLWVTGAWWWLWATAGWLVFTLVMGRLLPVLILPLFYKVTRLENPELLERFKNLTRGTGLAIEGVYELHLSEETKKANAALAGLGKSRRVLLGDTLLAEFSAEEIEVVFAHEVGHHVHRHLIKSIILSVVLAVAGFWIVDRIFAHWAAELGYTGVADPAASPLFLFVLAMFGLLLSPLQNALSRFYERQSDRYALDHTHNKEAYREAFIKLARINKSDPDPHPVVSMLFYDHPPIRERLAMAEQHVFV